MNIDDMPAGAEMDRLIAEAVLPKGTWFVTSARSDHVISHNGQAWMPSTDIAHAMEAIKPLLADDWVFNLKLTDWGTFIEFRHKPEDGSKGPYMEAEGDSAALALCRAALKAMETPAPPNIRG